MKTEASDRSVGDSQRAADCNTCYFSELTHAVGNPHRSATTTVSVSAFGSSSSDPA